MLILSGLIIALFVVILINTKIFKLYFVYALICCFLKMFGWTSFSWTKSLSFKVVKRMVSNLLNLYSTNKKEEVYYFNSELNSLKELIDDNNTTLSEYVDLLSGHLNRVTNNIKETIQKDTENGK